ncbi:MAG: TolC family protein [Chthoniobacteraceae bacterium]
MPYRISILLLLCTLAVSVRAGDSLTLASALARTLERSPELAVFNWDIRAAEARMIQARLYPNPELSLEAENFTGTNDFQNGDAAERTLQLSQLVELGGKREARFAEARAERALAGWEYQVKRVEVLKATTQAFIEVLVAQRQVVLARETTALVENVAPLTKKRVDAGAASKVEVTRANVAVATARIQLEQAARTLAAARTRLTAQWDERTADFDRVIGDLDRMPKVDGIGALAAKVMRNPQISRWSAERDRRAAQLAAARSKGRPDVTFMAGPRLIGQGDNLTAVAGVSLPLPLWNHNQGAIAEAQANLSKSDDEQRAAESRTYADLNEAYQNLLRARREAEILEKDVLPGAQEAEQSLQDGYAAGRFSQLELLDARRTLIEARNQHLRALADHHHALAEIEALTAAPIELPKPGQPSRPPASRRSKTRK